MQFARHAVEAPAAGSLEAYRLVLGSDEGAGRFMNITESSGAGAQARSYDPGTFRFERGLAFEPDISCRQDP